MYLLCGVDLILDVACAKRLLEGGLGGCIKHLFLHVGKVWAPGDEEKVESGGVARVKAVQDIAWLLFVQHLSKEMKNSTFGKRAA